LTTSSYCSFYFFHFLSTETKRSEFPRFYFVSDPTLLEILSLGSEPAAVVPHFQAGLFDSLSNVTFDAGDKYKITEMWSREGERVVLSKPVDARGPVEVWLQRLVTGMQETMRDLIRETAYEIRELGQEGSEEFNLAEFLFSRPAQVALVGLQMKWTGETLAALQAASRDEKGALTKALKRAEATLRDLVALALRDDLTKLQRTSLETCITVYIHQKEATEELVRKRVKDPRDFEWLKQCRVTWRDDKDTLIISICDVDLEYSYEYLGVKERLVITPLTDACYITLTQALGMFLGGAPAGPAGTGKTETTKDLGATLGKYVVVFNCSDQMDYKGMGKIFKGLAQSGLWGCFDEFNRINLDVLSVCAQQISCVLGAVRERRKSFVFTDGSTVPLDPRVGFFITMNPGYAGRQELPENLKALFRGVTMMVPNRQTIMKVKLAAAGFQDNEILAKKFNVLYSLCEQQLSKQPHYDFGLRNILSVLRTAGASKRASPEMEETELIMRTLRDMNMSKFVAEDVPLFLALIDDLFPGQKALRAPAADVATALEKVCADRGLQPHTSWMNKCIQLYETSLVRHGIMVVGPPGSGKSSAVDCLAAALSELGQKTVVWRMNPKSITAPQMFGRMDAATGDWTDGVFATLWRRAARAPKGQTTWIVLDGPVDAVWIENLNTVLDDNKVLTLANGDRVLMTPHMRLIFEPENLNNASPATVSRAGIIYMSSTELGWAPVVQSWLQARPEREALLLRPCFDRFVAPVLEFIKLKCAPVMATEAVCLVGTLLTLLTGTFGTHSTTDSSSNVHHGIGAASGTQNQQQEQLVGSEKQTQSPRPRRDSTASFISNATSSSTAPGGDTTVSVDPEAMRLYERHFLYCLVWSLGGLLTPQDRVKLDSFLRTLTDQAPPQGSGGSTSGERDTIYEYFADESTGEWHHWATKVPKWKMPTGSGNNSGNAGSGATTSSTSQTARRGPRFTQMVVPTLDSVRYERLLALAHAAGKASVLVGGPGTAKTTTVQQFLSRFDPDTCVSKTITFSSLTTPALFQASLENCVEKRQGRTFGPPGGKKSTIFLDDLSMPAVNNWGDQVTNELVRQVLEQNGWYSTEKPVGELKQLTDVSFVAAMNLPGAGRTDIPNRLKRHFCIFHMPAPREASITGVFGQLVAGHFTPERCAAAVVAAAPRLVPATMHLWNAAQGKLLPTPAKLHYSFTLRDMSKVFQGVLLASMEGMHSGVVENKSAESEESVSGEALLVSLWAHECRRVFSDKLIAPEEKVWVDTAIYEAAVQHFGKKLAAGASGAAGAVFADFLRDAPLDESTGEPSGPRPSCYEIVPGGVAQVRSRVESLVAAARETARPGEAPPDLVLFDDALSHVLRISRVLSMDRGSSLLVGVGGSGKQSLARLAAYLAGATCFKITLTKTYGVPNLLEDLKTLYKTAAFKPNPVAFLITEADIKDESFLEYINQVLSTGEVAGLFPREELDAVLNDIRPLMRATEPGVPDTWNNLYSFFINRVRDRLHLVLCVSPVGPSFARWAQQFPGLINGCTVDWFLPWPQEALLSGKLYFKIFLLFLNRIPDFS
jgi:dynein heavy chain